MTIKYTKGCPYQVSKTIQTIVPIAIEKTITLGFIILEPIDEKYSRLTLIRGFAWDGPSGPIKIIARLLPPPFKKMYLKTFMKGSAFHDALYKLIRCGYLKKSDRAPSDIALRQICLQSGMSERRADNAYNFVRLGGGPAADPDNKRKIYEAP